MSPYLKKFTQFLDRNFPDLPEDERTPLFDELKSFVRDKNSRWQSDKAFFFCMFLKNLEDFRGSHPDCFASAEYALEQTLFNVAREIVARYKFLSDKFDDIPLAIPFVPPKYFSLLNSD